MNFITRDVLYTTADIKEEAKAQLQGNWRTAIFLSIIPILFTIFFVGGNTRDVVTNDVSTSNNIYNIILSTVQGFLSLGVMYTFMDFLRNRNNGYEIEPLQGAIQAFRREYILNLFLLTVLKYIFVFLWSLLLFIPGIVKSLGYSQAEKIYKDHVDRTGEQPSPRECLRESERLMQGHKLSMFTLDLSFIGWHILAIMTFGIGYIWLTPYLTMSDVVFYENIREDKDFYDLSEEDLMYEERSKVNPNEEIGKEPDDFRDFEDF